MTRTRALQPFYVRYDLPGMIDSEVSVGVVGKGPNQVSAILYSHTLGWKDNADLAKETQRCPIPVNLVKTKTGRLKCLSSDPNTDNVFSPIADIY